MMTPACECCRARMGAFLRSLADIIDPPPPPDRPGRIRMVGSGFFLTSNLKEFFTMAKETSGIRIRGDLPPGSAYVSAGPLIVDNMAGNPMDPQPAISAITISFPGLKDAYIAADRRVVWFPDDAQPAEAPFEFRASVVDDSDADDYIARGNYDPDTPSGFNTDALGAFAVASAADIPPRPGDVQPPADPPADTGGGADTTGGGAAEA